MELCLALGWSLTDLMERMPAGELALWRAKWLRSPWGDRREDERHAMRLHSFTAVNSKKGTQIDRESFYPFRRADKVERVGLTRELSKAGNIVVKRSAQ